MGVAVILIIFQQCKCMMQLILEIRLLVGLFVFFSFTFISFLFKLVSYRREKISKVVKVKVPEKV